jgi:DNA invertase Pin-like site-specific DNA recombinase
MQLRELREYVERRGWDIMGDYVDRITGTKDSRPELNRLMADAKRRRFDAVLVWKFDRFARSTKHLLTALDEFRALGIDFVSLTEGIDTSTPVGKMTFTILGAVAELERSLIVERVKAGLRNARAKGKRLGRPRVAVDARRIAALRAEGHSWATIAERLDRGRAERRESAHPGNRCNRSSGRRAPCLMRLDQLAAHINAHQGSIAADIHLAADPARGKGIERLPKADMVIWMYFASAPGRRVEAFGLDRNQ